MLVFAQIVTNIIRVGGIVPAKVNVYNLEATCTWYLPAISPSQHKAANICEFSCIHVVSKEDHIANCYGTCHAYL